MKYVRIAQALAVIATFAVAGMARAQGDAAACKSLEGADFSTIQDAPAQVMAADLVDARGNVPAHCHVQGYVAPQVGFELRLPATWSGKFIQMGCGGLCGSTRFGWIIAWCEDALRRGHACILSDRGHSTSADGTGNAAADGLWAYDNLQGKMDYGFRAVHVATAAGKAITRHYYGVEPKQSLYMGCSGGGRGGLAAAQAFPWDFDGIIAMDGGPRLWDIHMTFLWNRRAMHDENGNVLLAPTDLDLLHKHVLARCDLDDGVADGVVSHPPSCKFDPAELACKAGAASDDCLSPAQVTAAQKVYSGPRTSTGTPLFYGSMPGSEKGGMFTGAAHSRDFFRYLAFLPDAGPGWNPASFDFDADYKRAGMTSTFYQPTNPDLRRFKAAGGKLLIVQGWDDSASPMPLDTIDYYETMERTMGGREATQKFARLFMMPGRAHCAGGPGANAFDFLAHLETWVDHDRAPDVLVGAHVESDDMADFIRLPDDPARIRFTRPVYPYPIRAKYKGSGDARDHRNFEPVPARSRQ